MKKNLIYALICCCTLLINSCVDNIDDASSKHKYPENENPYLKVNSNAIVNSSFEFRVGHFTPSYINLADYADVFKANLNMTVDQVIEGVKNKSIVFYNINVMRNAWNKTPYTKGTNGWYYNTAGGICTEKDTTATASIELDAAGKRLIVNAPNTAVAGSKISFNVGFAIAGDDYDKYVRFLVNAAITDPTIILKEIIIPAGDYNSYSIDLKQYESTIQTCLGITLSDFLVSLDKDANSNTPVIHMYMVNKTTRVWDVTSAYTASAPGYWINADGAVCSWGATRFSLYAETNTTDKVLNIGRAPGLASGTKFTISIGYRNTSDITKYFRFVITATLE